LHSTLRVRVGDWYPGRAGELGRSAAKSQREGIALSIISIVGFFLLGLGALCGIALFGKLVSRPKEQDTDWDGPDDESKRNMLLALFLIGIIGGLIALLLGGTVRI
jgi:hypothetical protein